MADQDKVRKLAQDATEAAFADESYKSVERILREGLKSLLDAAEAAIGVEKNGVIWSDRERLAAELKGWRKE